MMLTTNKRRRQRIFLFTFSYKRQKTIIEMCRATEKPEESLFLLLLTLFSHFLLFFCHILLFFVFSVCYSCLSLILYLFPYLKNLFNCYCPNDARSIIAEHESRRKKVLVSVIWQYPQPPVQGCVYN